ncbi:DUF4403 family protein [Achromobacter mucicolens]|uniref:DUF4403 family protein n=1 Tax=Achromobacter mucicolens TaxID=1389922 RepID=A0ABD4YV37_9BURK|nr:hypothetical protein [Achromobacter mucicolens]MDH1178229.1 DUF4403 family protein [Achromobacter mucicolens]
MPLKIWISRLRPTRRSLLAALTLCICLPASASQTSQSDAVQPPTLVWGAVPSADLYLLVASPRLSKPQLQQLVADKIGRGIGDDQTITQVWSNVPEPIQLWLSIDPARLRDAKLSTDQALEALTSKLGISAQPTQGIRPPHAWIYSGATREKFEAWSDAPPRLADGTVINPSGWTTLTYLRAPESWEAWNKVGLSLSMSAEARRDSLENVVSERLKALASHLPDDVSVLILPAGRGLNEADGIFVTVGRDE